MERIDSKRRRFCSAMAAAGVCLLAPGALPAAVEKPWKWSREAMHYTRDAKAALCNICPNECIIRPGKTGDCRTRKNYGGKLYSIAYGNPCAVHVDPIEKKPLFHFKPGAKALSIATAGCNLSCLNCQNWTISQAAPGETRNFDLMPKAVVDLATEYNSETIAYTYSEPIVFYEYMYDTAQLARKAGLKNLMVTAGYIKQKPLEQLCTITDAANVDLKSFSQDVYKRLNSGRLSVVKDTLLTMHDKGVWLEITNLIVPRWTDDMDMIKKMCRWLYKSGLDRYPLHFSRFSPMYKLKSLPPTPEKTLARACSIAKDEGIKYVYMGNVSGSSFEDTKCHKCGEVLIERKGFSTGPVKIKDGKCPKCGAEVHGVWK